MKFNKKIDFFIFYKIVTFFLDENSSYEDIVEYVSNLFKICSCRVEIANSEKNIHADKKELFIIYINLSESIVTFNFENESRIHNISKHECISIYSEVNYKIVNTENTKLLKCLIFDK